MKRLLHIALYLFSVELSAAVVDLDNMQQTFVLETKRFYIPNYPDAFNPSIVRLNNQFLMSFRSRDAKTNIANLVGFVWLDDNLNPVSHPKLLECEIANKKSYIQDPRLITVKDKLYIAYSDLLENPSTHEVKRTQCIAELYEDDNCFLAINRDCFFDFEGDKNNKFEKNWVPFNYQDIMLLAYSIAPHKIFLPVMGENRCATIAQSSDVNPWNWGILRGGTTALPLDKNHYLSFFHSSIPMATLQSKSKSIPHYFMGAYIFENKPPFAIKKMSPSPIVTKDFYTGEAHPTWKPLAVVFPCGFVYDEKYIWVSYGRQDYEAWVVKLDKSELLRSLIPVESNY